jgi:uroporphyrinogen decarboxylase
MSTNTQKPLIQALRGKSQKIAPAWMMRQAGRYLPEYREVRKGAGDFLNLCYTPSLAAEVTLQPIRRYQFDAAIIFSDILVIPDALGQNVAFKTGEGPVLEAIRDDEGLQNLDLDGVIRHLEPVFEALDRVAGELPDETALIGFCGAPWTVATYMVGGRGSADQKEARLWAYRDEEGFGRLIDLLVEASILYLCRQVDAGAEVLQIFDSWAGSLPPEEFYKWCQVPMQSLVKGVKAVHPDIPIIGFPKGCGELYKGYVEKTGIDGVSIDTSMPVSWARENLQGKVTVQGNLDPLAVVAGGEIMADAVRNILQTLDGGPFIFNLGHGLIPETPPENVQTVLDIIRNHDV